MKRHCTGAAISFWFALEMHYCSALGAKFTFVGKYNAALANLAYSTQKMLHFITPKKVFPCWMMAPERPVQRATAAIKSEMLMVGFAGLSVWGAVGWPLRAARNAPK